ncbi:hypothetical protein [Streptomyces sp. IMTB 2501]|uniref:hypothetical protein n=1 Tax=Streptomyces sp. IMTB 2501 TaxID=1776340 RepID=UPI0015B8F829|nr:hypothetical protein [Streptomyces sp. IMTB 2501]
MARNRQTYPDPRPVDLPIGFHAWLLDCAPVADCETCQSEWQRLNVAKGLGDITQAAKHATNIRDHAWDPLMTMDMQSYGCKQGVALRHGRELVSPELFARLTDLFPEPPAECNAPTCCGDGPCC